MNETGFRIKRPTAGKIKTQADIVFCIDATGSMDPCIEGVKEGIYTFVEGLQSAADVDYRLRLIAYRDRHDPSCGTAWHINDFTNSVEGFLADLDGIEAEGGGDASESTLDALYIAIQSDWRTTRTHKTIVLFTDADTHPHLHPSTYNLPDNGVNRVIQEFQTLRHVMLFMVLPDYPAYRQLEQSMNDADRKIVARFVPRNDERYTGLRAVEWEPLLKMLGQTVSRTSTAVDDD